MKKFLKMAAGPLAALALAACPGDSVVTAVFVAEGHPIEVMREVLTHFPNRLDTGAAHVPGSIFQYGIGRDTPFIGIVGASLFYTETNDGTIAEFMGTYASLIEINEFNQFSNEGVARFEFDVPSKMLRFIMQEEVSWHDGVPLTMRDLYYTFHVMADPDYSAAGGVRFTAANRNIRGIMDYHNGLADSISGLILSDNDRTLTIYFDEFSPDILYFGIWTYPMPRHIFEGTPVLDIPNHPGVRANPIGWGPFKYVSHVPGESFLLERNDDYVWGRPLIEQLVIRRVPLELIPAAMEAGEFDYVVFPPHLYADFQNPTNYFYMGNPGRGYSHFTFRLGHFDFENSRNVFDAHRPMNNVHLRRAMALAADEHLLGQTLYNGLQFTAGSFLVPRHEAFMDMSVPMFGHDPARANQILDDAGFRMGADGYRTWPDGRELTVTWALSTGATSEALYLFYTEAWRDIGIRVELWQGIYHDINFIWDTMDYDTDNEEIDLYNASWNIGPNPNPFGIWGHTVWNSSRYTSDEWDALQARLESEAAWDHDYLLQVYSDIQWYMYEQVFFFPLRWSVVLTAINNRVTFMDMDIGISSPLKRSGWHLVGLSAAQPYAR